MSDPFPVEDHLGEVAIVPAQVGMMSLIGVSSEPPHAWGNYFWLASGERVVNMWAENLQAAVPQFIADGMVTVRRYKTPLGIFALVIDDRIPESWLYNKFCFTGGRKPPADVAKDMYSHFGDPNFEFEQFIDPMNYWTKRDGNYNASMGSIMFNDEAKAAGETYRASDRFKMEGYYAPLVIAG